MVFPTPFLFRNVVKSNLKTDAGIELPQASEKWAKCSNTGPNEGTEINQKSKKNPNLGPQVPSSVTLGIPGHKNTDSESQKASSQTEKTSNK